MANKNSGNKNYVYLILRRDRTRLPLILALILSLIVGLAKVIPTLFPTSQMRETLLQQINSQAAEIFLLGKINSPTIAGIISWRLTTVCTVLLAILNIFTIIRHTRQAEETGYNELLAASNLGKRAPTTAVLLVTTITNFLLGISVAIVSKQLGFQTTGSLIFALQITAFGLIFSAIACLCAQLANTAKAAREISFLLLTIFYILRGLAEITNQNWLQWTSPLAWVTQTTTSPTLQNFFGTTDLNKNFFGLILQILTQILTIFAVQLILRLQSNEQNGFTEILLATPISKLKLLSNHTMLTLYSTFMLLNFLGLSLATGYFLSNHHHTISFGALWLATLSWFFAMFVVVSLALFFYAWLPKYATILAYSVVSGLLLIELLANINVVSEKFLRLSPFAQTPNILLNDPAVAPFVWMLLIAIFLIFASAIGMCRRDIV